MVALDCQKRLMEYQSIAHQEKRRKMKKRDFTLPELIQDYKVAQRLKRNQIMHLINMITMQILHQRQTMSILFNKRLDEYTQFHKNNYLQKMEEDFIIMKQEMANANKELEFNLKKVTRENEYNLKERRRLNEMVIELTADIKRLLQGGDEFTSIAHLIN